MSGPEAVVPRCEACHAPSAGRYKGNTYLCEEHLAKWKARDELRADLAFTLSEWQKKHGLSHEETVRLVDEVQDDLARYFGDVRERKGVEA